MIRWHRAAIYSKTLHPPREFPSIRFLEARGGKDAIEFSVLRLRWTLLKIQGSSLALSNPSSDKYVAVATMPSSRSGLFIMPSRFLFIGFSSIYRCVTCIDARTYRPASERPAPSFLFLRLLTRPRSLQRELCSPVYDDRNFINLSCSPSTSHDRFNPFSTVSISYTVRFALLSPVISTGHPFRAPSPAKLPTLALS